MDRQVVPAGHLPLTFGSRGHLLTARAGRAACAACGPGDGPGCLGCRDFLLQEDKCTSRPVEKA